MKKALFIDRDGTIIKEPPVDYQVDSLEKLEFRRGAISALRSISGLGFELVMATNQDGLGTESFPEETFRPAHDKMLSTLEGEDVVFDDFLIDRSFEHEGLPTRKPRTGMFGKYLAGGYDLASSYVIGDRITDVMLAANLGAKAILMQPQEEGRRMLSEAGLEADLVTEYWAAIAEFLRADARRATVTRGTKETSVEVSVDLDGHGETKINTGLGFLDHMLQQIPHHGGISLVAEVTGDLHVDEHHTMEDVAIVLGEAVARALGDKRGIERYGFVLPMDDCDAMVLIDFGGRTDFRWNAEFRREMVGDTPTEMFPHFFKSFAEGARCNLHIEARGDNEHHKIEGIFKAFARALRAAVKRDIFSYELPSSKGVL